MRVEFEKAKEASGVVKERLEEARKRFREEKDNVELEKSKEERRVKRKKEKMIKKKLREESRVAEERNLAMAGGLELGVEESEEETGARQSKYE